MLASDLIVGGSTNVKLDATTAASDYTFTDATLPVKVAKISVYRNGVKMLGGTDYTVAGAAGSATLTVVHAGGTDPEDYAFAANDRIEIQWVK